MESARSKAELIPSHADLLTLIAQNERRVNELKRGESRYVALSKRGVEDRRGGAR